MDAFFSFVWDNIGTIGIVLNLIGIFLARRLFLWNHVATYVVAMLYCIIPFSVPTTAFLLWAIFRRTRPPEREIID